MSERLVVTVDSGNITELTSVQDVFEHVLQMFELVSESDADPEKQVVWKLISATTNSPLTVVAEAVPKISGAMIDQIARDQMAEYARNLDGLRRGQIPQCWRSGTARKTAKAVMLRSRNRVASTKVDFQGTGAKVAMVELTKADAEVAVPVIEAQEHSQLGSPKVQIGSVEGYLKYVGTFNKKPAVMLRGRKDDAEIWCVVPEEYEHQFANRGTWEDVWHSRRVVVRGTIHYNADHKISQVVATSIRQIENRDISTESIQDKSFTGGLSAAEYLERLREGMLG